MMPTETTYEDWRAVRNFVLVSPVTRLSPGIQFGYTFLIENVLKDMDPAIKPLLLEIRFDYLTKGAIIKRALVGFGHKCYICSR